MTRYILLFLLSASALLLSCCADSPQPPLSGPDGSIENGENEKVSVFHLSAPAEHGLNDSTEVVFRLVDPDTRTVYNFDGSAVPDKALSVLGSKESFTCRMRIGDTIIDDGAYFVTVSIPGKNATISVNLVKFKNGIGAEESYTPMPYPDLQGEGTAEAPYLINDPGDLMILLYYLGEDKFHGFGMYFRQTESFDVPRRSEIIDGRSWTSTYFQGNYDGGGHELRNLAYIGGGSAGADDNIGLFRGLFNASVSNLKITGAILSNPNSNAGLLAGTAEGDNIIKDITIDGTIMASGDNVAGLIGYASGYLSISSISMLNLTVSGKQAVGGIIGNFDGDRMYVDSVSTPNHIFSFTGERYVGGVAGIVNVRDRARFTDVMLDHDVDAESSDIKVISASSGSAGGIVGKLYGNDGSHAENCTVRCPVSAPTDAGAFVGESTVYGRFSIEKILLTSVVTGEENTGGFFGSLTFADSESDVIFTGPDNTSRYVVKQSAEAHVRGGRRAGTIAGYVAGNNASIKFDTRVEIAVNVKGSGNDIGGAFGYVENLDTDISKLNMSSATMRVEGDTYVGGIFGYATNCHITGPNEIDIVRNLPSSEHIVSTFGGVVTGRDFSGGISGFLRGKLSGVASSATVTSGSSGAGIASRFNGEISQCAFSGTVSAPSSVGGIAAYAVGDASITDCVNYSDIKGGDSQGGIMAVMKGGSNGPSVYSTSRIHNCANKGSLTDGKSVGGIVALVNNDYNNEHVPVKYCVNFGDIKANGSSAYSVGGIVAEFYCDRGVLASCANHGDVSSGTVQFVIGGVAGRVGEFSTSNKIRVEKCMNSGKISCDVKSTKIGGVVGSLSAADYTGNTAIIRDCYNTGSIQCDQKDDTGGILGYASSYTDTHRTFNRGMISHGNAIIGTHSGGTLFSHSHNYYLEGTGKSWPSSTSVKKADIADKSKYGDFDFENVWRITDNGPVLRDCPFQ